MEATSEDQEVMKIASNKADAKEEDIPGFLIKLSESAKLVSRHNQLLSSAAQARQTALLILLMMPAAFAGPLEKHSKNSDELQVFEKSVWKYDLLSYCVIALRYDFTSLPQGLAGAVSIVKVLCECSCSLQIDESQEFSKDALPEAIPSILRLLRIFQRRLADLPNKSSHRKTDEALAEEIFGYLKSFVTVFPHLCSCLLNCSDLVRIILEDDKLSSKAILLVQTVMLVNRFCLPQVGRKNLCALLDELVYILTTSEDEQIAGTTTRLLLSMCDAYDEVVDIMIGRFKGLKAVLNRWKEHGFTRSLQRLIQILEAGNTKNALLAKKKNAVNTIWAFYIGWKTRQRMRSFQRNIPTLQRSFRKKQSQKKENEELKKSVRWQETETKRRKQRSFRQTREKQLQSIEIVPAKKVTAFIQNEEHKAATKIQAHWRAFEHRKLYNAKLEFQKNTAAAITIQKAVRKFLTAKSPQSTPYKKAEKMDAEKKSVYAQEIKNWQMLHKPQRTAVSRGDAENNQKEMQKLLLDFYRTKTVAMKNEHKTSALLARIHTEEETLNHLPPMSEAASDSIDRLACKSAVIQRAAVIEHNKEKKQLAYPWWKKFAIEDDELTREGW